MKVSIIIPVYNLENYLRKCLDSILAQTYSNIEIIVVNDGSSDNSASVIDEYTDERIINVDIQNQGVTAARKVGWQNCSGDYCLFVDGDDTLPVDAVSFFVDKINEGGYDFVQGWYDLVDENGVHTSVVAPHQLGQYCAAEYIKESLDSIGDFQSVCIGVYKRSVITEDVFNVDRSFYRGEDALTLLGILNNCTTILVTDTVFYHYFQRSDSVSHSKPISVEYIYSYNKFRYTILQSSLRSLIEFNTLQRILPAYLRFSGSDNIKEGDQELIEKLICNFNDCDKSLKLKIQIMCFRITLFEKMYKYLITR